MPIDEILTSLHDLTRADKWRVVQFLVIELAKDENALLDANAIYPVWSPYNSFDAAEALLNTLKLEDQHA